MESINPIKLCLDLSDMETEQHIILVEKALQFIRDNEPEGGYHLCDSGGKDSTVMRHLTILSGVKYTGYYSCTRIDPPEVVKFIRQHHPDTKFLYPKKTYWAELKKRGTPTICRRWCCDVLKKDPTKHLKYRARLVGIRKEESFKRSKQGELSNYKGIILVHPIYNWTEYHIWKHIELYNLPYCSLYDDGWSRIGCMLCPFTRHKEHQLNKIRWPGIYNIFEQCVTDYWEERKKEGKVMAHFTAKDYIENWYKGALCIYRKLELNLAED